MGLTLYFLYYTYFPSYHHLHCSFLLIAVFLIPILVEGDIKANEIKIRLSSEQNQKASKNKDSKDTLISQDEVERLLKQAETFERLTVIKMIVRNIISSRTICSLIFYRVFGVAWFHALCM